MLYEASNLTMIKMDIMNGEKKMFIVFYKIL